MYVRHVEKLGKFNAEIDWIVYVVQIKEKKIILFYRVIKSYIDLYKIFIQYAGKINGYVMEKKYINIDRVN